MSEFLEIIKQRNRMCKRNINITDCTKCGLYYNNNGTEFNCVEILYKEPERAEEIIMKWTEENPVKTNYDKLVEVFGDIFFDPTNANLCNMNDCEKVSNGGCDRCICKDFWDKEYQGVIKND